MKLWTHEHHVTTQHEFFDKLSQWTQGDNFWIIAGIIMMVGVLSLVIYLMLEFGPTYGGDQFNSLPNFFTRGTVN